VKRISERIREYVGVLGDQPTHTPSLHEAIEGLTRVADDLDGKTDVDRLKGSIEDPDAENVKIVTLIGEVIIRTFFWHNLGQYVTTYVSGSRVVIIRQSKTRLDASIAHLEVAYAVAMGEDVAPSSPRDDKGYMDDPPFLYPRDLN
jgi:hypothetical protein